MRGGASLGTQTALLVAAALYVGCGGQRVPDTITVVSPNGGETWLIGWTGTVTWSSTGKVADVAVGLSTDGGASWTVLVASTGNDGSEDVTVPDTPSTQCLVRVMEADGAPADESDAEFAIIVPTMVVISPNGGETWYYGGDDREIEWTAAGIPGDVEILYTADDGVTWTVVAVVPAAGGSYAWVVPNEDSTLCRVRVQMEGGSGPSDESDGDFTITATPLPDSGVSLTGLGRASLAWGDYDSDGDLDLVITGESAGSASVTWLYRNEGGGSFSELDPGMIGARYSGIAWGDYDNDGDLDVAIAGYNPDEPSVYEARIYRNDGGGSFADINAPLLGVSTAAVAWGDYDSDGDLDLALAGWCGALNFYVGHVYRNEGGDVFTEMAGTFPGVSTHQGLAWGDCDNDGDLDLAVAGMESDGTRICEILQNDGGGALVDIGAGLPGVRYCALAWGDCDNDGDLDLALSGHTGTERVSDVYRNDGGGVFVPIGAGLRPVDDSSVSWGDYDNDGDLDLSLGGIWGHDDDNVIEYEHKVYRNDGAAFADMGVGLTGLRRCSVAWGDYDNDGDLDLAGAGQDLDLVPVSTIYTNDGGVFNTLPSAPVGLSAAVAGGDGTFSWSVSGDNETPAAGLSYNLRVGTTSGGEDVSAGMADLSSGYRRIPAVGSGQSPSWVFKDLPADTYYWSVQAVDAAFAGSAWSGEWTADVQPWVRVVYPNGGELWRLGSTQEVQWRSNGVATVRIDLSRDDGTSWETIGGPVDATIGLYGWTVIEPDSDRCLVRVCDAVDDVPAGQSGATFTIPGIVVTSPNGGEVWRIASAQTMTWESVSTVADVRIELYRNGSWEELEASIPNTGTYSWDPVMGPPAEDCLVRVTDAADGTRSDTSDAVLTIPAFNDVDAGLIGVYQCSLAWGDYDNDGSLDLALAGYTEGAPWRVTRIYRNTGTGLFEFAQGTLGLGACSLAWGDYDGDGDLDLAVAGYADFADTSII